MKFTYQFDASAPLVEFTLPSDTSLPEAVAEFEKFLLAAGYCFEGHFDIVEDESDPDESPLPF